MNLPQNQQTNNMVNITTPAYPVQPMMDSFKRIIIPDGIAGISKLEHFTLEIYKAYMQNEKAQNIPDTIMRLAIDDAEKLLDLLQNKKTNLNNEKANELPIFDH